MTIGEAIKERILQLCAERDLTINKLSTISCVTQSTVNNVDSKDVPDSDKQVIRIGDVFVFPV